MATNQLLPFATGTGAGVYAYADWLANNDRQLGFVNGTADPKSASTALRQAAFVAAMIGQFTTDTTGLDTLDNGSVSTLEANFRTAIIAATAANGIYFARDTGTADAAVMAPLVPATAYFDGMTIAFIKANAANATTVPVVNVSSLGGKTITSRTGSAVTAGDLAANSLIIATYDATQGVFRLWSIVDSRILALVNGSKGLYGYYGVGTYTFTVPAGCSKILVTCVGGAGGGGGTAPGSGGAGGGGGAGGVCQRIIATTPGTQYTIVVGQGGVGGVGAANSNGAAGSLSAFGSVLTSTGGAPGTGANAGGNGGAFGTSGVGSGGDINLNGGAGTAGSYGAISSSYLGIGGTGGANPLGGGVTAGGIAQGASGLTGTGGAGGANGGGGGTGGSGCVTVQCL